MEYLNNEWPIITALLSTFIIFLKVGLPNLIPIIKIIMEPFQKMATAMEKNSDSLETATNIIARYENQCKIHQDRIKNKLDKLAIKQDIPELDELFQKVKEEIENPINLR